MLYRGSKKRLAKYILPIILDGRKKDQWYVEPFCGGCNSLDQVDGNRIGNDIHPYLIAYFKALQSGWLPPEFVSEKRYKEIKENQNFFPPELVGYVGFSHSRLGDFFSGYIKFKSRYFNIDTATNAQIRDSIRCPSKEAYKAATIQQPLIRGIKFYNEQYFRLKIPKKSIIYLDPPYENTSSYNHNVLSYELFWQWARELGQSGHKVFVSSYKAPAGWLPVFKKEVLLTGVKQSARVEKLYRFQQ